MKGTRKPRQPQQRSLNFIPLGPDGPHALFLSRGNALTGFWITEIPPLTSDTRTFRLDAARSRSAETFLVQVAAGDRVRCDCPDGTQRGRCRHADAVLALLGRGGPPPADSIAVPRPAAVRSAA